MKATGKMTYFMAVEHITLIKVGSIKANFIMVKPMVTGHQLIMTGVYLRVNLKMAKNMEWDFTHPLKAKSEWENGEKGKE